MSRSRKLQNGCGDESSKPMSTKAPKLMEKKREYSKKKYLHQDFVMEEILTKVPVRSLLRSGAVSKHWGDFLHIYHPPISGESKEYKLVSVFRTSHQQLNIVVFTLGTKSWRNVTTTSTHVAYHGHPITWIRASTSSDRSAIFCNTGNGCLVWKIITTIGGGEGANGTENKNSDNQMEMLLSFNLHDEKFSFIQLPSKNTTDEQRNHLLKKHCTMEQVTVIIDAYMTITIDKVKQAWVKEESFDVRVDSPCKLLVDLPPDPCCFCIGNTSTPPTRIFSFSDQILLYWFDGKHLQVYNLCSKKLTVVMPQHAVERDFFDGKMKAPSYACDDGDNIYCSNMDYQLHCQGENFLSLQSFVPEGVAGVDAAEFEELNLQTEDPPYTACVYVHRADFIFPGRAMKPLQGGWLLIMNFAPKSVCRQAGEKALKDDRIAL
ncbi:hypothetical protein C5167_037774 [Papaver somniferum]|uniref:F-box associated domain-containing protein n=1 Tax=Papaver somniferum TaxID=3469 RepID=A0A4Y7IAZ9_PAPSO|nr:hypothetical protein C5167_037774 [Papaver somniferum]